MAKKQGLWARMGAAFDRRVERSIQRAVQPAIRNLVAEPDAAQLASLELVKALLRVVGRDEVITTPQLNLVLNNAIHMIRQHPNAQVAEIAEGIVVRFSHEFSSPETIILQ